MAESSCPPATQVPAKRSFENVQIQVDWHNQLANLRRPGAAYAVNDAVRLRRAQSTGLQYKCTTAGVTAKREPRWPTTAGQTVTDGSVVWTAEAISGTSLRTTVSTNQWPAVTGLTLTGATNADHVYTILADGGTSGQTYEIKHQVTLANGEESEALIMLPVCD